MGKLFIESDLSDDAEDVDCQGGRGGAKQASREKTKVKYKET